MLLFPSRKASREDLRKASHKALHKVSKEALHQATKVAHLKGMIQIKVHRQDTHLKAMIQIKVHRQDTQEVHHSRAMIQLLEDHRRASSRAPFSKDHHLKGTMIHLKDHRQAMEDHHHKVTTPTCNRTLHSSKRKPTWPHLKPKRRKKMRLKRREKLSISRTRFGQAHVTRRKTKLVQGPCACGWSSMAYCMVLH